MYKFFSFIILLAMYIALSQTFVIAQEAITLKDAVKIALENNNELLAMKNSLSATERDIGIARSLLMPKLKMDETFVSTNNPGQVFALKIDQRRFTSSDLNGAPDTFNNPGIINNFMTGIAVEQPIFLKKANVGINMAKKEYSAQGYEYLRKQEELILEVSQAYLIVSTSQEYINVADKAINDAKEHLRIADIKYQNGTGLYSDVLRANTALTEAQQNFITAQKNSNLAKRTLGLLLGKTDSVDIIDTVPDIAIQDSAYYDSVSLYRNDIKSMELKVENANNNIKFTEADYFPTIGAGGGYQLYDHRAPFAFEGHNYTVSGSMKWDAFDGKKRKYEKLKAQDKFAEAQQYLEGFKKSVSYKVFESLQEIEEAKKNLELSNAALLSAEEGKRLVLKRWENSLSPFVELMDTQTNLDRARANVIKSQNNYKSALLQLSFESGTIFKDLGIN
jgi:outer membrane protein TolC